MSQTLAILGRQPALGMAELESLFGSESVQLAGNQAAIIDKPYDQVNINNLGGTIKVAKLLTKLDFTDWHRIERYLVEHVPKHTCCIGPGKLTFGISAYRLKTNQKAIERTALSVKKAVRSSDNRPVRVVPTKGTELSSAQVLHNKMYLMPFGMELLLVQDGNSVWLAQTSGIQDIDAYTARDQARPKRDSKVGMLPPKLAQIIINMAHPTKTVLDPFCGTGVLLQEALLMDYDVIGTDLEPRMIDYSEQNLTWLSQKTTIKGTHALEVADATSHHWEKPFDCIAAETYLGRPFSDKPDPAILRQVISDVNTIHKKFLKNVASQTKSGFRMTVAVPAWQINGRFEHLSTLDHLEELGYTRASFKHVDNKDLIYHREGQIVGRELVTLIRK